MNCGILQFRSNLREIQIVFPDHLFTYLELNPADILTGRDLQILMEQRSQIAGTDIHLPCHKRYRQFLPDMGRNVLLGLADDLIFSMDGIGSLKLAASGRNRFPQ